MTRALGRAAMRRQGGFTLVELLAVVAIIGVLAVVAGSAFRKYGASGRKAEAMAMIGELKSKEEAYRAENATYLSTDTAEANLYPVLGVCGGQTEPCPKTVTRPASWVSLGVSPTRTQLYCGYVVIAGSAGAWGAAGTLGQNALGGTAPSQPWYYIVAQCDNDKTQAQNTTYVATSISSTLITLNEGR